jgi:hypothetical protein
MIAELVVPLVVAGVGLLAAVVLWVRAWLWVCGSSSPAITRSDAEPHDVAGLYVGRADVRAQTRGSVTLAGEVSLYVWTHDRAAACRYAERAALRLARARQQ